MRKAAILTTVLICVWWARSRSARATGFEYGANGAEAVGRAGAYAARADDATALYYDVAGIGRAGPGTHLLLDANFVLRDLSFDRGDTMNFAGEDRFLVNGRAFPEVNDRAGYYPAPFFGLVTDLGLDTDFEFAFGIYGPAAVGRAEFPADSAMQNIDGVLVKIPAAQRYDLLSMNIVFLWPTLAAAWRINDDLSIGLGFQSGVVNILFDNMATAGSGAAGTRVDAVSDLRANLDVWDWFVPAGIAGVWYRPCRWFEMAWAMRVSDSIHATGSVETISNPYALHHQAPISSSSWNYTSQEQPPSAELSFSWPLLNTRLGFRFVWPRDTSDVVDDAPSRDGGDTRRPRLPPHLTEWMDVEADVIYEMDSSVDTYRVKLSGQVPTGPDTPPIAVRPTDDPNTSGVLEVPHNWQDTVAVRLGGDVNVLDGRLSLHWGASYESSTVPESWTRLDYAQWETFGVAGGLTVHLPWNGIDLTGSYMHLFMPDRTVTDGQARVLTAFPAGDASNVQVINDGSYRTSMDIFSVGVSATF